MMLEKIAVMPSLQLYLSNEWYPRTASQAFASQHACPWSCDYSQTRHDWTGPLSERGILPVFTYDAAIAHIPQTITPEERERARKADGALPTPEEFLADLRITTTFRNISRRQRAQMSPADWRNEDLAMFSGISPTRPTARESDLLRWTPGYGTISPWKSQALIPVEKEYLFCIMADSVARGLYLSAVQERHTGRLLFGFRAGAATDFPFDPRITQGQVYFGVAHDPAYTRRLLDAAQQAMSEIENGF